MKAQHIDKTDFLNAVVREKKRFENTLDDSVAAGLNAGTEVLMNQVWMDHLLVIDKLRILSSTGRTYNNYTDTTTGIISSRRWAA